MAENQGGKPSPARAAGQPRGPTAFAGAPGSPTLQHTLVWWAQLPGSCCNQMKSVTIYTTRTCGYCRMAKALLARKGAAFEEIDVTFDRERRSEMTARAGGRTTVPQIWIGEQHVGGCDDLYELERAGSLDAMLAD
jgi:glutaredoxin 3